MKLKRTLAMILCVILMALPLMSCKGDDGKIKITLSEVTHSIFYAPLYVAINNGYFDEYNIKINLVNGGGADKVMTAIASKSADIGLMGPEATI